MSDKLPFDVDSAHIFYVPLERSKYLLESWTPTSPSGGGGGASVHFGSGQLAGFDEHDGMACVNNIDEQVYEYDYKQLLRDVVNPKNTEWWDRFEDALTSRYSQYDVLDTIFGHFNEPNISHEVSLQLLKFFSRNKSAGLSPPFPGTSDSVSMAETTTTARLGDGVKMENLSAKGDVDYSSCTPKPKTTSTCSKAKDRLKDVIKDISVEIMSLRMLRSRTELFKKVDLDMGPRYRIFRKLEIIKEIVRFLDVLKKVLCKYATGEPTDKTCFMHAFQSFARIFFLDFCPVPKRVMKIYGNKVSTFPDLRYEVGGCAAVVTVAEVKQEAKEVKDVSDQRKKIDDIDLSPELRGRHAAELFLELPFTALTPYKDNEFVLGVIVQCTRVRLTCLKMKKNHRKLLESDEPQELGDQRAEIHYTRGYDMLKKEDRKHLGYIFLLLAYLGDENVFNN